MKFWKMNGAGNDFIIIDNIDESIPEGTYSHLARTLCERHLSIGADGMMFVENAGGEGDYRMAFYNADGSRGEMCGNGARCICRYGYETGLAGDIQRVETVAGLVVGRRIDERLYKTMIMEPGVVKLNYPVTIDSPEANAGSRTINCSYIEIGNPGLPHAVVFYDDIRTGTSSLEDADEDEIRKLGRILRYNAAFPKGANINFIEPLNDGSVFIKTYERGVEDITYACGTGTVSAAVVLAMKGLRKPENIEFRMKGGLIVISMTMDEDGAHDIYLTGPTNIVATGEITDEDL